MFCNRAFGRGARKGNVYQGIILDPPAYGHGPDGEKWKLDELLFDLLKNVAQILSPRDSFMLCSNGCSAMLGETTVREAFVKVLPLSIFVRLKR